MILPQIAALPAVTVRDMKSNPCQAGVLPESPNSLFFTN